MGQIASETPKRFTDRRGAGRVLAAHLRHYAGRQDVVVLALPRGGVPVAYEVARALGAPLDVFVVRKLGTPGHEELAMGAVASGGTCIINHEIVAAFLVPKTAIDAVVARETLELERRARAYRGERPALRVQGCTCILIDDGLATGATMRAAATALRQLEPERIVIAAPVAARESCEELASFADEIVCASVPSPFYAGRVVRGFSPNQRRGSLCSLGSGTRGRRETRVGGICQLTAARAPLML
jgi:putative phosphoribosyl transferase